MPEHAASSIAAVRKSVTVPATPDRAFALFTAGFGDWWPLATHSVGTDKAAAVAFGTGVGGIIVETLADGTTSAWGHGHRVGAPGPGDLQLARRNPGG